MITKEEQISLFYDKYNIDLLDLLEKLKEHCDTYKLPLLNNLSNNHQSDFIDLILENVNLKKNFINHYKLFK